MLPNQILSFIGKPLVLLAILFFLPTSHGIDTEDVQKLADEVSSLTSSTWDIIAKLRHVSKHAITFVRIASPVGSLIAAAADVAFKPDSPEYEAIQKLHHFVEAKFAALSRHVEHQTNEIKFFLAEEAYYSGVTRPLNNIERFYSKMTDPFINRTVYKAEFVAFCTDRWSPHNVLLELKSRLFTNCPIAGSDECNNFAEAMYLFKQIETHHRFSFHFDFSAVKQSILSKGSHTYVVEKLQKIQFIDHTDKVEQELQNLRQQLSKAQNLCWPQQIVEGNHWKREAIYHFAEVVRMDILKASIIGTHCANVSSENAQKIHDELNAIGRLLQEVTDYFASWIVKKLEISWPTIMRSYAKEGIGAEPVEESATQYMSVAMNIKNILNKMGPNNFFHNILVFPNWDDGRQFGSICPAHYCLTLFDTNAINVLVVRYHDGQYTRAGEASAWLVNKKRDELTTIITDWQSINSSQPLATLIDQMKNIEGFADPDLYPHVVVLRNWMYFKVAAKITLGYTRTLVGGTPTQQWMNTLINPSILADAKAFHTHFFL